MKNFKFLMLALVFAFASCSKDHINDINEHGGKVEVGINIMTNTNNGLSVKSVQQIDRVTTPACVDTLFVIGERFTTPALESIDTIVFNDPSDYPADRVNGSVTSTEQIKAYMWPGENRVKIKTTSYVENPLTDPRGSESDGISAGDPVDDFIQDAIKDDHTTNILTKKYVNALRSIPPYATFNSDDTDPNNIYDIVERITSVIPDYSIDAYANEGRIIITCEFDQKSKGKYEARFFPTEFKSDGTTYDKEMCPDEEFSKNHPCWYYWSNKDAKNGAKVKGRIEIYKKNKPSEVYRVIDLYEACENALLEDSTTDTNYCDIENGKDKWLRVVLNDDDIETGSWWKIVYHWVEEDHIITTF